MRLDMIYLELFRNVKFDFGLFISEILSGVCYNNNNKKEDDRKNKGECCEVIFFVKVCKVIGNNFVKFCKILMNHKIKMKLFPVTGYTHNPYNGVICNDIILATGVFSSKELWKLSKCKFSSMYRQISY